MIFQSLEDGQDPPDVRVLRNGSPPLDIEVREYHPDVDRVGMEKRARQFLDILDGLVQQQALLKGVHFNVTFRKPGIPQHRHYAPISQEAIRCTEYAIHQGWIGQKTVKFSVQDFVKSNTFLCLPPSWIVLPAGDWPVLFRHVDALEVFQIQFDGYLPSSCYQAQTAYCSPYAAAFSALLNDKHGSVHEAIQAGRFSKASSPLWLLLVSNTAGDLSSEIFGDWQLKQSVADCGFDFENSLFDEVWLMSEAEGGRSQRLHPWADGSDSHVEHITSS